MSLLSEQDEQEAAFMRAAGGYTWRGNKLEPYSYLRIITARALGMDYGYVTGKAMERTLLQNMAKLFWVCSQDEETCYKALDTPDDFKREIITWATEKGVSENGDDLAVFLKITTDAMESEAVPKVRDGSASGGESPNVSAPPKRQPSSVKSRSAPVGQKQTPAKS